MNNMVAILIAVHNGGKYIGTTQDSVIKEMEKSDEN